MHNYDNNDGQARYIRYLASYLSGKNKKTDNLNDFYNFEKACSMSPKIFERAYVLKERYPYRSDEDCFFQAEREICDQKKIDYWAYICSENRKNKSLPGDENSDHAEGEEKLHKEGEVAQKAYELWEKDPVKKSEEYYWFEAQKVLGYKI